MHIFDGKNWISIFWIPYFWVLPKTTCHTHSTPQRLMLKLNQKWCLLCVIPVTTKKPRTFHTQAAHKLCKIIFYKICTHKNESLCPFRLCCLTSVKGVMRIRAETRSPVENHSSTSEIRKEGRNVHNQCIQNKSILGKSFLRWIARIFSINAIFGIIYSFSKNLFFFANSISAKFPLDSKNS